MRPGYRRQGRGKKLILQPERLFALRLAKALGRITEADQVLEEISGTQLAELAAYDRIEGLDNSDHFQRLERILCVGFASITNTLLAKGEVHPADFAPPARFKILNQKKRESEAASLPAQKAFLRHIATLHNARHR